MADIKSEVISSLGRALNSLDIFERNGLVADSWQKTLLACVENRIIVCCSRQAGKTLTACAVAVQYAGTKPNALIIIAAPTERQAKETLKRAYELLRGAGYEKELSSKTVSELAFKNGSRIIAVSGQKPENIRGYPSVSMLIVDESAFCCDELFQALTPMMATNPNAKLILLSTPAGPRGFFYKTFKFNDDFLKIEIPATQIQRISKEFLESERKQLGEAVFRSEYLCDFNASDHSLLPQEIIDQTFVPMGTIDTSGGEICFSKETYSLSI